MYRLGLWALMVACGAAFDVYDDSLPIDVDDDILYQGDHYNFIDPGDYFMNFRTDPVKNLFMSKLMNSMSDTDGAPFPSSNRPFLLEDHPSLPMMSGNELTFKNTMAKRPDGGAPVGLKDKPVVRKQPKWKNRKGRRVGSQIICYFKLCAFKARV